MALLTEEIRSAINNKGLVVITSALAKTTEPGSTEGSGEVDYQFKRNVLAVRGDTIILTRVANDAGGINSIA